MPTHATREAHQAPVLAPTTTDGGASIASQTDSQNTIGNQAVTQRVEGIAGRTFNRILCTSDSDPSTFDQSFGPDDIRRFLDEDLAFAKGEWFRGSKLTGVAEKLVENLDKNGDGRVDWPEFQAYRAQMLEALAPGATAPEGPEDIHDLAAINFMALQQDGVVGYSALEDDTRARLDADASHPDLIAQLGALLVLDAADTDQTSDVPRERVLDEHEWMSAVKDLSENE